MQKWWQKIILLVAVATILGHGFMPHHHHDAIETVAHHQDHDEGHEQERERDVQHHHNLFSFAQLDEDFIPAKLQKGNVELPILYLLTPAITYHFNQVKKRSKAHFGFYREFPPPDTYTSQLFSRPPPACWLLSRHAGYCHFSLCPFFTLRILICLKAFTIHFSTWNNT